MDDDSEILRRARAASLSGDYREALELIGLQLSTCPHDARALILKGNTLELEVYAPQEDADLSFENCKPLAEAKSCYEQALKLAPHNTDAMLDLANLFRGARRYDDCIALLRRAEFLLRENNSDDSAQEVTDELMEVLRLSESSD